MIIVNIITDITIALLAVAVCGLSLILLIIRVSLHFSLHNELKLYIRTVFLNSCFQSIIIEVRLNYYDHC